MQPLQAETARIPYQHQKEVVETESRNADQVNTKSYRFFINLLNFISNYYQLLSLFLIFVLYSKMNCTLSDSEFKSMTNNATLEAILDTGVVPRKIRCALIRKVVSKIMDILKKE